MYRNPTALVLPGVGSLTSIYVQVAPVAHLSACGQLTDRAAVAFAALVRFVAAAIEAACGGVTVFEHGGSADRGARRSACIDHAHAHVLAGTFSFAEQLPAAVGYDSYDAFLAEHDGSAPYLMYCTGSGPALVAADIGESQYFRRLVAAQLGIRDEWDWALFPQWTRVRETVTFLSRLPWPDMSSVRAALTTEGECTGYGGGWAAQP